MKETMATATTAVVRPFSEDEFIDLGLNLRRNGLSGRQGRKLKRESQVTNFRSSYTVHPAAIAAIWLDLQTTPFIEYRIDPSIEPSHLLLVYRWLSKYESEKDLHNTYGYPEKDIRHTCRDLTRKIAALKKIKVSVTAHFNYAISPL